MKELRLFPESGTKSFRAYMSSALTGFPNSNTENEEATRVNVLMLNRNIQNLCKRLNVELYLPQDSSNPASSHDDGLSPDEVYFLDRWRIAESSFMILNGDNLSFGVGQEIEIANSMGIPTIIFYGKGKTVSRMIKGAPCIFVPDGFNKADSYIVYENNDDLLNQLENRIKTIKASLEFDDNISKSSGESFSKKLKDIRESKGLTYQCLSKITGFSETFVKLLETEIYYFQDLAVQKNLNNKNFFMLKSNNKFTNPGLYILETISKALTIDIHQLLPSAPHVFNFSFVDIYKEALLETTPSIKELLKINESLSFDFHRKVAAYGGDSSLTKESIVNKIQEIMKNG